jgi:hypothetical protein
MYIVEKYRPKRKQYGKHGRFRKCEKIFLAAREKNFPLERNRRIGFQPLAKNRVTGRR